MNERYGSLIADSTYNEPKIPVEEKEKGIYEITMETKDVLRQTLCAIDTFRDEIKGRLTTDNPSMNIASDRPQGFKDDIVEINDLAHAVRATFDRLMKEFR